MKSYHWMQIAESEICLARQSSTRIIMTKHQDISGQERAPSHAGGSPANRSAGALAMTAAIALPFAAHAAADESDLLTGAAAGPVVRRAPAELVRRSQEAVRAFMRGDVPGYLSFIDVAGDFTLMQPFGGEVTPRLQPQPGMGQGDRRIFQGWRGRGGTGAILRLRRRTGRHRRSGDRSSTSMRKWAGCPTRNGRCA